MEQGHRCALLSQEHDGVGVINSNDLDGSKKPRCYTCWSREQISFCWNFTGMIMMFTLISTTGIKTHELVLKRMI
jgi:hypothetical protein